MYVWPESRSSILFSHRYLCCCAETKLTWCLRDQMSRKRPVERCHECGSVYKMEYVGPADDPHAHHDHHGYEEPKTFADYVKPEYW